MRILSIQEAYKRKFKRQKNIKNLEYHAAGHCVHIGKLSPGCYSCFVPDPFSLNLLTGTKCNLDCVYCVSNRNANEQRPEGIKNMKLCIIHDSCLSNYNLQKVSFSGGGEPLMYMDIISDYMDFFHGLERYIKNRPWYHLYTNGVLVNNDAILHLKDLGFDEIRFHLGASNFSKKVYKNMTNAVRYFKVVSIETPAWPPHRKKLFEMLPIIEDIGIKHLNIGEIVINRFNYERIYRILPDGEMYQCYEMHLYDGGLAYDIFEEVIRKKYSYSVLDCNCFVKSIQRGPARWVSHQDVNGLCTKY